MKKLFSIMLAMAMLFSISIVPAFAASTTCEIIVEYATALTPGVATTMTLTINVDDDTDKIMAPFIIFNANGFDSIEMTGASDFAESERAFVLQDYGYELQAYNGNGYPDGTSFTFTVMPNSADASIEFDAESSAVSTVSADVYLDTITVKVPEKEEESHEVASAEREAVTEKATHQIGTAVGMKVTTPEDIAFTKMIWAIANGSERLYAKNIVELPKLSGDIWVAATFVNGSHNDVYENAKVVAPLTIGENDFDAIFYGVDADGNYVADYFTNEDADKKAE